MDKRSFFFAIFITTIIIFFSGNNQLIVDKVETKKNIESVKSQISDEYIKNSSKNNFSIKNFSIHPSSYISNDVIFAGNEKFPFKISGKNKIQLPNIESYENYIIDLLYFTSEGEVKKAGVAELVGGSLIVHNCNTSDDCFGVIVNDDDFYLIGSYTPELDKWTFITDVKELVQNIYIHKNSKEKFYVIENDYLQVVFSNINGSISEINLPLSSKSKKSPVRPVEVDNLYKEKAPFNNLFSINNALKNDQEIAKRNFGSYYPLLRRSELFSSPYKFKKIPQNLYSMYVNGPGINNDLFEVIEFTDSKIVFESVQDFGILRKTYNINKEEPLPYIIDMDLEIINGKDTGLYINTGILTSEEPYGTGSPIIKVSSSYANVNKVKKLSLPNEKKDELFQVNVDESVDWICNSNGYFGLIIDPLGDISERGYSIKKISGNVAPDRYCSLKSGIKCSKYPSYNVSMDAFNGKNKSSFRIYAGPIDPDTLNYVDSYFKKIGQITKYASAYSFHGFFSFISAPFAKFMMLIMDLCYKLTHSWVAAIFLLTVILRIILYPLNGWSMKSMKKMQEISPEVEKIQKKYKNDPKKAQIEIVTLYKKNKVNPFSGCLPIFIQMPFLLAMFELLKSSFALRGETFIKGWINDLTAPDVLFSWGFDIPFIGSEFHLLPIILGLLMFLQQFLNPTSGKTTDQQRQQRASSNIMAVVFVVMFYNFPAGLNIYWLFSTLFSMIQQWYTNKKLNN